MNETKVSEEEIREAWEKSDRWKINAIEWSAATRSLGTNHRAFRLGYIAGSRARAAKHAEEVAHRDAHCESYALQIERLIHERDAKEI